MQHVVDDAPLFIDAVAATESSGIALHGVFEQSLVRLLRSAEQSLLRDLEVDRVTE